MKVNKIILFFLCVASMSIHGQFKKDLEYSGFFDSYYWRGPVSFTGGIGSALSVGDLCSDLSCTTLKPYYTVGAGYKVWPRVFFGGDLEIFNLEATDSDTVRNISFTSTNVQFTAYGTFSFREDIVQRHGHFLKKKKLFKPYAYLGVGVLRYDVTASIEEANFPKWTINIPVGLGAQFHITHRVSILAEAIYRIGFTDLLDGVSENGNPDRNDAFGSFSVKLRYTPFARRIKPKKVKIDPELRKQWNDRFKNAGDSTSTGGSGTNSNKLTNETPSSNDEINEEEEDANDRTETDEDKFKGNNGFISDDQWEEKFEEEESEESEELEEDAEESSDDDWGNDSDW